MFPIFWRLITSRFYLQSVGIWTARLHVRRTFVINLSTDVGESANVVFNCLLVDEFLQRVCLNQIDNVIHIAVKLVTSRKRTRTRFLLCDHCALSPCWLGEIVGLASLLGVVWTQAWKNIRGFSNAVCCTVTVYFGRDKRTLFLLKASAAINHKDTRVVVVVDSPYVTSITFSLNCLRLKQMNPLELRGRDKFNFWKWSWKIKRRSQQVAEGSHKTYHPDLTCAINTADFKLASSLLE